MRRQEATMESENNEQALTINLLESGRESTFSYKQNREQLEDLRNKVLILESENIDLRHVQPRLIDAHGKDVTEEFSKLARELQNSKNNYEALQNEHRKLLKSQTELEQSALVQIDQRDNELSKIKRKAMELEEENSKLREQIHDEQSKIHRFQSDQNIQTYTELHFRDQIQNNQMQKKITTPVAPSSAADQLWMQLNDELTNLDINDADQIATHIFMILEKLEKNNRDNKEIQKSVFAFLSHYGLTADSEKAAIFSSIYKEAVSKKLNEIRNANDALMRSRYAANGSAGNEQFEHFMGQLYQESVSTTLQSFAGLGISQQFEQSIAEHANVTIDSMNTKNLAERTADLAEVCIEMFEKLRGTAEFFQQLLNNIGVSVDEVGEDLMHKIVSMKLDLDKSVSEARGIVHEAKNAEQNIRLFLEQSSQIAMNSTAFEEIVADNAELNIRKKCKDLEREVCEKCSELEIFYESAKSALDDERERKKLLVERIEQLERTNVEFEATKEQLMLSIKKCDKLQQHFDSVKSELNSQFKEKKDLLKKIAELEEKSSKLEEEKEQINSSIKENQMIPRAQLVEGIRGELGKIYDTMALASSSLKKKPILAPSQKTNQTKKKNANKRAAAPPTSSSQKQSQSTSQTNKQVD